MFTGAILSLSLTSWLRAQSNLDTMNVMRVRLDTVTIQPGDRDIFVNAYYTFHLPKPHDIHAFDLRFFYDSLKTRLQPFILDGTACVSYTNFSNWAPPEAKFVVDGSSEINLTDSVLFRLYFTRGGLTDSESLIWDRIYSETARWQVGYLGLDTIILEDGWMRVQQPSVAVRISTPPMTVASDSTVNVPLIVSDLSGANVLQAQLGFVFDTTVLKFKGVAGTESGVMVSSAGVTKDSLTIDLTSSGPILGGDSLVTVSFDAVHRIDTVSTSFTAGSFIARNFDALVGNVQFTFNPIRVEGMEPLGGVSESGVQTPSVEVFPNPASVWVRIRIAGDTMGDHFGTTIFDALGNEIFQAAGTDIEWKPTVGSASGTYEAIVTNFKTGARTMRTMILAR